MPAINPARLKQQAALLANRFNEPSAYVRSLHHLLDSYADRVRRSGELGEPPSLLSAYHVRPQIMRHILQELIPLVQVEPDCGLALCDALWEQPYFEFRLLAASLLGHLRGVLPESILHRVRAWITPDLEARLSDAVLDKGLTGLRQDSPVEVFSLVGDWLDTGRLFEQKLGLHALLPFVKDPGFENLPVIFRLIQPMARVTPAALRPDLLDVLSELARRSPHETAFFLRQTLSLPNSPDTPMLVRQSLRDFPPGIQYDLRSNVRGLETSTRE